MESNEISKGEKLLTVLTNMAGEIEKLENVPKDLEDLENRLSSLEKKSSSEEPNMEESSKTSDRGLEFRDSRITELESQRAFLESPEYRENLILDWLHDLDQESYYSLGVRKGYLEEINPASQPPLGDLKDPSPEVIFSQEKPEDLTGWAYSKTLNCYVKLEGGMEV